MWIKTVNGFLHRGEGRCGAGTKKRIRNDQRIKKDKGRRCKGGLGDKQGIYYFGLKCLCHFIK